jgi:outer membrane autotransporter protein
MYKRARAPKARCHSLVEMVLNTRLRGLGRCSLVFNTNEGAIMQHRTLLTTTAILTVLLTSTTRAEDTNSNSQGFYAGVRAGYGTYSRDDYKSGNINLETDFKGGFSGSAVAGYSFANGLRPELEAFYQKNNLDTLKVNGVGVDASLDGKTYGLIANALYDIKMNSSFTPYVGAGLGYGFSKGSKTQVSGINIEDIKNEAPIGQLRAGVGYRISSKWIADVGYTHRHWFDSDSAKSNIVQAGLRYQF